MLSLTSSAYVSQGFSLRPSPLWLQIEARVLAVEPLAAPMQPRALARPRCRATPASPIFAFAQRLFVEEMTKAVLEAAMGQQATRTYPAITSKP